MARFFVAAVITTVACGHRNDASEEPSKASQSEHAQGSNSVSESATNGSEAVRNRGELRRDEEIALGAPTNDAASNTTVSPTRDSATQADSDVHDPATARALQQLEECIYPSPGESTLESLKRPQPGSHLALNTSVRLHDTQSFRDARAAFESSRNGAKKSNLLWEINSDLCIAIPIDQPRPRPSELLNIDVTVPTCARDTSFVKVAGECFVLTAKIARRGASSGESSR
jgi:hypothetical protein